jgi:STE24 endopeptidase
VQGTSALLVAHVVLTALGPGLGMAGLPDVAGMPLLAMAAGAWSVLTAPVLLAQSRRQERRADRFALALTAKTEAFVSAMRRLGDRNLAESAPSQVVQWLFHSHPPLTERIASAQATVDARGPASA